MKSKKFVICVAVMLLAIMCGMFAGCGNKRMFDTTWTFEQAIIYLPDGEKIEGKVTSWDEFESSDMMQVTIDGKTYLTHSSNVLMISE